MSRFQANLVDSNDDIRTVYVVEFERSIRESGH